MSGDAQEKHYNRSRGVYTLTLAREGIAPFDRVGRGRENLPQLPGYVGRKVIDENAKQRQSGNAVRGQHPHTASFMGRLGISRSCRGITQGLILHAKTS